MTRTVEDLCAIVTSKIPGDDAEAARLLRIARELTNTELVALDNAYFNDDMIIGALKAIDQGMVSIPAAINGPNAEICTSAIASLWEKKVDGSTGFLGTAVVMRDDGLMVTALHNVEWDGSVYPDALRVQVNGVPEEVGADYLAGSRDMDIAALRLEQLSSDGGGSRVSSSGGVPGSGGEGVGGGGASSSGGSGEASGTSSSSGGGTARKWPYLNISKNVDVVLARGTNRVALYGYAKCAQEGNFLAIGQPLCRHGWVSHSTPDGKYSIADYVSFAGDSGGAVVSRDDGCLVGIHIEELADNAFNEEDDNEVAQAEYLQGSPVIVQGLPTQQGSSGGEGAAGTRATKATLPQEVQQLGNKFQKLHLCLGHVESSRGAVGIFVPISTVIAFLGANRLSIVPSARRPGLRAVARNRHMR